MSDGKMARSAAKVGEPLGQKFPKSTFIFENQAEPGAGNNDGDHHDDDDDEDDGKLCRGLALLTPRTTIMPNAMMIMRTVTIEISVGGGVT